MIGIEERDERSVHAFSSGLVLLAALHQTRGSAKRCLARAHPSISDEVKTMATSITDASTGSCTPVYPLGDTYPEQECLIRQASRLAPCTEHFFRDAGICLGQRVLDLGSGVGDVAMLLAGIVGPSGTVLGVERDVRSVARARARVADAGLCNVSFIPCDVNQIAHDRPFDAAVGRFILMSLPDPVAVLRSVSSLVRPSGILAFQEPSWFVSLLMSAHLPLWSRAASLSCETLRRSGANPEIGLALYQMFQAAGLPAPAMRMEIPLGNDRDFVCWMHDVLCSLRPQIEQHNLSLESLGDFDSLSERLQGEIAAAHTVAPWMALIGASTHTCSAVGIGSRC
jgi:SAM-dependent methyltransferase